METPYPTPISPSKTRIGWIGIGVMGSAMASRLLSAGYSLTIYARNPSKAHQLISQGAKLLHTPHDVALQSDLVFTMVGHPSDVRSVVLGDKGILSGLNPGGVIVDTTSSHPALAREIFAAAREKGCWSIDSPVSGGDIGARDGRLAIFAGGDENVVNWLKIVYDVMGKVTYVGEAGCGHSCKIANQIVVGANLLGLSEALVFAEKAGLDLKEFLGAIRGGSARSMVMELFGDRMIEKDFRPGGFAEYMVKDMGMGLDFVEGSDDEKIAVLPAAALGKQLFSGMVANGDGHLGTQGEKLELSNQGQTEVRPSELGEEIRRKRECFQNLVQPSYRKCKRNEVKLEIKLAVGFCPSKITVEQAQKSYPRWIVLDSCLKKYKLELYQQVGCNIAVLKGKDVATLMPSRAPFIPNPPGNYQPTINNENLTPNQSSDPNINQDTTHQEPREPPTQELPPQTQSSDRYPLSCRTGFPRAFSQFELDVITKGFSEEAVVEDDEEDLKVYEGMLQDTPVLVQSFVENDDRFWTMLQILSRVRHRNILNLVGHCCTSTYNFLLCDYPFMGTLETNLQCDELAKKLPWKARWYIATEIGGSLRYLHEECVDGTIVHLSVCSSNVVLSHGCATMLDNFRAARLIKNDPPSNDDSPLECVKMSKEECLSLDIRDYGVFLVELLSGKSARLSQFSLTDWALPLLENGRMSELLDPRLSAIRDKRVDHMIIAASLCLKNYKCSRNFAMSEVN